jgi:hypothetical protein
VAIVELNTLPTNKEVLCRYAPKIYLKS